MPLVERFAYLHHSAEQMFDLVADVEAIRSFFRGARGRASSLITKAESMRA